MLKPDSIELIPVEDLIHLRMPEAEARDWLLRLTPEQVTPDIFARFVSVMRQNALPVPTLAFPVMDCCGTGGSGRPHFNTSTTAAFVLAAGGVKTVKFGNRAMSSQSGSFDFLQSLGFSTEIQPDCVAELLDACNVAFLYAPQFYPCLGPFNQLRRSVGVRTIFNFIGPLLNPASPAYRLLGVSHAGMQAMISDSLRETIPTAGKAWVVNSPFQDATQTDIGLDEIACEGVTIIHEIYKNQVRQIRLEQSSKPTLPLGKNYSPEENKGIFERIIQGKNSSEARMVCLNAGAGFYIAGKASSLEEGVKFAEELLSKGKVQETFNQCRRAYDRLTR